VFRHVDARVAAELGGEPLHDEGGDIGAAGGRVAVGRDDLHDVVAHLEDRDVERATAEVVDGGDFVGVLGQAKGERGGRRLVDDALDVEAGDFAGVLGSLALRVVEVGGNGDDRLGDFLPEIIFGGLLEFLQNLGAHFRRRHVFAAHAEPGVVV